MHHQSADFLLTELSQHYDSSENLKLAHLGELGVAQAWVNHPERSDKASGPLPELQTHGFESRLCSDDPDCMVPKVAIALF